MRQHGCLAVIFFMAACGSCGGPKQDKFDGGLPLCSVEPAENEMSALTFNAGLAPGIEVLSTPRTEPAARAVSSLRADIICLQEVWTKEAVDAMTSTLGLPAENVFYADTSGENETGADRCTQDELEPFLSCAREKCANVPAEDTTICAKDQCVIEGLGLYLKARPCFYCVLASVGKAAEQIAGTCVNGPGATRMYGGRNGVILASRRPLRNREALRLPASFANRVALLATIDVAGAASVEVACTHLSSDEDLIPPSHPDFKTWIEEQIAQLRLISGQLKKRAKGNTAILMGDVNCGPAIEDMVTADTPEVWEEAVRLGFESPAVNVRPPLCSRCAGNTVGPTTNYLLIDHILVRGLTADAPLQLSCGRRVLDATVSVTDLYGNTVTTNLSDHYGILLRFRIK